MGKGYRAKYVSITYEDQKRAELFAFKSIGAWRAGCGESRTSGSGRGSWKRVLIAYMMRGALAIYFTPCVGGSSPLSPIVSSFWASDYLNFVVGCPFNIFLLIIPRGL